MNSLSLVSFCEMVTKPKNLGIFQMSRKKQEFRCLQPVDNCPLIIYGVVRSYIVGSGNDFEWFLLVEPIVKRSYSHCFVVLHLIICSVSCSADVVRNSGQTALACDWCQ